MRNILVIPKKTDVELDHLPWATAALIGVNVLVAVLFGFPDLRNRIGVNAWVMRFDEFDPPTWITAAFLHGGWIHLLGNMLFFWVFGMAVEAYVGWRRFLAMYLGMALLNGLVVWAVTVDTEVLGGFGASDVVWGLFGIAALWAPKCTISGWYWILTLAGGFNWSLTLFMYIFVGFELFSYLMGLSAGYVITTPLIHMLGGVVGALVGFLMLKMRWVDCGGWDLLSIRRRGGRPPPLRGPLFGGESPSADPVEAAAAAVRGALKRGDAVAADAIYGQARQRDAEITLPPADLIGLVQALLGKKEWARAVSRLQELAATHAVAEPAARLALAQIYLRSDRRAETRDQLDRLADAALDAGQRKQRDALRRRLDESE